MHLKEIKNELQSDRYSFLQTNVHLGNNIILLTLGGSHAYGTDVETSDLDIRGVTIEDKQEVLGLSSFEQFEHNNTDTVVYALKKFINLVLNSNPNVLEMLGTKEEHLLILKEEGKMLKDNLNLFLSKRAIQSFGNYATAQLRRLQNALARDSYPQGENEKHVLNSILSQMDHFKRNYQGFSDDNINLYIDKSDKEEFGTEIFFDINLKHYPLRDFKNIYASMSNVIKDYSKLNHRNKKKDELHLNKHAMHLIRLLVMGTEILEGKGVNTYREKDRDLFLDIRDGKYGYPEIFEMVDEFERKFKFAAKNTSLPDNPDFEQVEDLLIQIYERAFK